MLKNISRLECQVNEKHYRFDCDYDSVLPEVKHALLQFLKHVEMLEERAIVAQEALDKAKKEQVIEPIIEVING